MPSNAMSAELRDAINQIVTIVNEGDKQIELTFDGQLHRLRPKSFIRTNADRAWHWFGNPTCRTSVKDWNEEVHRVRTMHGYVTDTKIQVRDNSGKLREVLEHPYPTWQYIMDGHI